MSDSNPTKFISYYDMAMEAHSALRGDADIEIDGVSEKVKSGSCCNTSIITILDDRGAKSMGRPKGQYVTLQATASLDDDTAKDEIISCFADILKGMLPPKSDAPTLICGIGNPEISSDSLGEKTVSRSLPTRHLFNEENRQFCKGMSPVALVTPNVLGNTGIETFEIIQSVAKRIGAGAVIIIDALSTAAFDRLGSSFQLTNTGIVPGGGIGNERPAINEETLHVPVIAIGVPTVIYPQSIVAEVFSELKTCLAEKENAASLSWDTAENTLYQWMNDKCEMYAVTPKDIDCVIANLADILTAGIHIALHEAITKDNYREYLSF
ncbi:MAG TPA: GPR endopeptidase [Clostridiales bacterium]|nr:GPR endopeptidase [Clostridiales bacterium]